MNWLQELLGQRGLSAFVNGVILIVLYLISVATGRAPLSLPVGPDGVEITPDLVINLIAPAALLVYTFSFLLRSITTRVVVQDATPNSWLDLIKMREFWLQVVQTVFAGLMIFKLKFWQDGQEATVIDVVVNLIMTFITSLLGSYSQRPNGAQVEIVQET